MHLSWFFIYRCILVCHVCIQHDAYNAVTDISPQIVSSERSIKSPCHVANRQSLISNSSPVTRNVLFPQHPQHIVGPLTNTFKINCRVRVIFVLLNLGLHSFISVQNAIRMAKALICIITSLSSGSCGNSRLRPI